MLDNVVQFLSGHGSQCHNPTNSAYGQCGKKKTPGTCKHLEMIAGPFKNLPHFNDIAGTFLESNDIWMGGKLNNRVRIKINSGKARYIVQDKGDWRAVRNSGIMGAKGSMIHPWPVVVRGYDHRGIRSCDRR